MIIVVTNIGQVLPALAEIFKHAFTPYAGAGGCRGNSRSGHAVWFARGVYSNEAGMGSGMGVHAAVIVDHPVRQAAWGFGVCSYTIVVCTITILAIMLTGSHIANPERR